MRLCVKRVCFLIGPMTDYSKHGRFTLKNSVLSGLFVLLSLSVLAGCGEPAAAPKAGPVKSAEINATTIVRPGLTVAELSNGLTVIVAENHNSPVVLRKSLCPRRRTL